MRLIDADKLEEALHYFLLNKYSKKIWFEVRDILGEAEKVEAIPIDWLQKKLIEYVCNGKYTSSDMPIVYSLISDWRKENEID